MPCTVRRTLLSATTLAGTLAALLPSAARAQAGPPLPVVGAADIGGTVASPQGPEAGVWVIAETTDLPTKFAKTVVTDDAGRYVVPDVPR